MSTIYREPSIDAFYQISVYLGKQFHRRRFFFRNQPIRNKNGLWWPCLLTDRNYMSNVYRGPFKDASYHVLIHLAKRFQRRRIFKNQPIRNKNGLWRSCLLTDQDEINSLYRGPSIYASYQVSVHLVKRFQRRWFLKIGQSETRIAGGGHVCLIMDRDKMSNLYRGPSIDIDASYQVSVHLAEGFQRRRLKCEKLRRRTPSDDKSSLCLWQGELKINAVFV